MAIPIYGQTHDGMGGGLALSFDNPNSNDPMTVLDNKGNDPVSYPVVNWSGEVEIPKGAEIAEIALGRRLVWKLNNSRQESSAQTVWAFANENQHGFRIVREMKHCK